MRVDTRQIKWLLSHETAYRISKLSGVPQPNISNLVNGKRKVFNLSILTGHLLTETACFLQREVLGAVRKMIAEAEEKIGAHGCDIEVVVQFKANGYVNSYQEVGGEHDVRAKELDESCQVMTLQELLDLLLEKRQVLESLLARERVGRPLGKEEDSEYETKRA